MQSKSQVAFGLMFLGLGLGLLLSVSGCDDGCVRNSDCPMSYACTDAVCTPKATADAGMDAGDAATSDHDAGG